jgi:CheY-like chemotaxis protein
VLVVDDEESVRSVCRDMVRHLGCPVLEAADGFEALALFRERGDRIAVVLLDLSMPGMDGVATMREILALRPGARVLLSSGFDRSDAVRDYEGAGAAGFIQKPYSLEGLRRALREAAKGRG